MGTGNNLIEFTGTGGGGNTHQLRCALRLLGHDEFDDTGNSQFSLPDVINGWHTSSGTTDKIDVSAIDGGAGNVHFYVAADAVGVLATVAGSRLDAKFNVVYEQDNGHIFMDTNGNGLVAATVDMEVTLMGVTGLSTAAQVPHVHRLIRRRTCKIQRRGASAPRLLLKAAADAQRRTRAIQTLEQLSGRVLETFLF